MAEEQTKFSYFEPPDPNQTDAKPKQEMVPLLEYDEEENEARTEGMMTFIKYKMRTSPFFAYIPFGLAGIFASFAYGVRYGLLQNSNRANVRGMTGRLFFQGTTLFAVIGDYFLDAHRRRKFNKEHAIHAQTKYRVDA